MQNLKIDRKYEKVIFVVERVKAGVDGKEIFIKDPFTFFKRERPQLGKLKIGEYPYFYSAYAECFKKSMKQKRGKT
eukprot:snap_masked-scaffold_49-processed-gene-1.72-mRNA-1 protein AED:1.00 eAED:1.00 QI:0/0/0/0/1/1/2/0/75